ncbi:phage tail protein [Vibrio alginolyticus]|uniref:GDSL-type esterase/lipase family protein n=1 Tax=Vibrio alginolyticus TaxID=663 RepID=UPI00216108EB|nr:GDSL-type esterase/lipase family protein [Vibrio alginolyticus]MCS0179246.1 phage tail protein [Vibrio alginolyticus]
MANSIDKSILTAAGKALLAQLNAEEKALVIDKMIFANVPNRPEYPQPDDVVPTEHIVHQEQVEQRGRLSADSVIYSSTLTSDVGPFDFNWTGAYCSEYGVLVTIDHHALTPKTADEPGVAGNTLVRSVVLEYKDIAEITNITVDASSWQYNATERMKKMDSDVAQSIIDQNGKDWFIEDGFLVTPLGNAYSIKAGVGYVSGNRILMEFDRTIQVANKPSFVYVDAFREGTPTGEQVTIFNFIVTTQEIDDYVDNSTGKSIQHYVCKLAQVFEDGTVADLRPEDNLQTKIKQHQQNWQQTKDLDYEQLHAKLGVRNGVKLAFLGDSIMAGVGADAGVYGEANKEWITFPSMLSSSLVFADQGFHRVDEVFKDGDGSIFYHLSGTHGLPYVKLEVPQGQARLMLRGQDFVKAYSDVSIYCYSSSLSDYTDFNVSVYDDGVFVKTDTVKAVRERFVIEGITNEDVLPQLTCHTINVGQLLYGNIEVVIDNPSAGKIVQVIGVTMGRGVHYKNFGVSSMTLKNESPRNLERGVTTDGQIQKALDFNADYIFLNWGTNDSKTNVSSLAEYNSELKRRIGEIRGRAPNTTLVLCTYPQGRPDTQYQNNELYAQEMRKVASDMDVTLVDVNKLFKLNDEGSSYNKDYNIYADSVHPSVVGYSLWASSVCSKLKVPFYSLSKKPKDKDTFVAPPGGEVKFSRTSVNVSNPSSVGDEIKEIISGTILNTEGVTSDIYVTALVRCGATAEVQGQTTLYLELSADDGATWFEKDMLTLESHVDNTPYTQFTLRCHHAGSKGSYKYRISGKNYYIRSLIQSRLDWNISPR